MYLVNAGQLKSQTVCYCQRFFRTNGLREGNRFVNDKLILKMLSQTNQLVMRMGSFLARMVQKEMTTAVNY